MSMSTNKVEYVQDADWTSNGAYVSSAVSAMKQISVQFKDATTY